ncbi:beta-1,3-galactosyltransferase brn [Athalia rosae]|uniref:beta-1,3-galactosyltransferase brn n=1 Tax=Athalia rosae TaxID=37344 RepID=UPI0020337D8F|nr:beta-1,3-galactosyltransferase brn [Athalia rosae]
MFCILEPIFRKIYILSTKVKLKYLCFGFIFVATLDFFGVFTHVFEATYDETFLYPYEGDIHEFVSQLRHNEKPDMDPINQYNYSFLHNIKEKCFDSEYGKLRIVFLVKSAVENFERRIGIRNSWGFEKRFYDVPTRTVFLLGQHPESPEIQAKVKVEAAKYKDIVQIDFIDAYFNNTIKTMMGFKWVTKHCLNSKFYMFVDDDMYISVKNILRFVRHPTRYPDYLKDQKDFKNLNRMGLDQHQRRGRRATAREKIMTRRKPGWKTHNKTKYPDVSTDVFKGLESETAISLPNTRVKRQIFDFELPEDVRLFAGFVFTSSPHRHKSSKWYVSLDEYPYHLWPPYITAGAYILSKEALLDMYYTSFYTKHFRFDDIYLGLVAKKADIEPFHCDDFYFYKKDYTKFNYKYVIASHGYGDPNELIRVWNEQKAMGYA